MFITKMLPKKRLSKALATLVLSTSLVFTGSLAPVMAANSVSNCNQPVQVKVNNSGQNAASLSKTQTINFNCEPTTQKRNTLQNNTQNNTKGTIPQNLNNYLNNYVQTGKNTSQNQNCTPITTYPQKTTQNNKNNSNSNCSPSSDWSKYLNPGNCTPSTPSQPSNPTTPSKPNPTNPNPSNPTPNEPDPSTPSEPSSTISAFEQEVINLTNAERSKAGLAPLTANAKLGQMARAKSEDMRDRNYFDHNSPTYGSPFDMMRTFGISYSAAGENIAAGQATPADVVRGWMNSSGHRQNILNANFTQIGVGYASGGSYGHYWSQEFIR